MQVFAVAVTLREKMAVIRQGMISLSTFLGGSFVCFIPVLFGVNHTLTYLWEDFGKFIVLLYGIIYNIFLTVRYSQKRELYKVGGTLYFRSSQIITKIQYSINTLCSCSVHNKYKYPWQIQNGSHLII